MTIDEAYRFINFVANKEQRGYISPESFNLLATVAQKEFISKRLGNIKLGQNGSLPFGYKSTRKISEDLRPLVYGPIQIPIDNNGLFYYPEGYMWPDSFYKNDFSKIFEADADEYPGLKSNAILSPSSDYPCVIFRTGVYGFIDPYNIGSFKMTYLKSPITPNWDYIIENDSPIYVGPGDKTYVVKNYNFTRDLSFWSQNGGSGSYKGINGSARVYFTTVGAVSPPILYQPSGCIIGSSVRVIVKATVGSNVSGTMRFYFLDGSFTALTTTSHVLTVGENTLDVVLEVPSGTVHVGVSMDGTLASGTSYFEFNEAKVIGYPNISNYYFGETDLSSQNFAVNTYTSAHEEICMIILQNIGINLDSDQITHYSKMKEDTIS